MYRAIIIVDGRVQGVGFRWWASEQGRQLRLTGHAENLMDGTVRLDVQGGLEQISAMIRRTIEVPTTTGRPGMVTSHTVEWRTPEPGRTGFRAW